MSSIAALTYPPSEAVAAKTLIQVQTLEPFARATPFKHKTEVTDVLDTAIGAATQGYGTKRSDTKSGVLKMLKTMRADVQAVKEDNDTVAAQTNGAGAAIDRARHAGDDGRRTAL